MLCELLESNWKKKPFKCREEQTKSMVISHARWDSLNNREILTWLTLASRLPEWPDILKQRLTRDPHEIVSLRTQYDTASPEVQKQLAVEHQQLAEAHPENADLQYLRIRLMPDSPVQNAEFIDAYQKWPESLWLCYAAALLHERSGDWQAAKECLEKLKVSRVPTYDRVAVELARIRRYEKEDGKPDLNDLKDCLVLDQLLSLESGKELSGLNRESCFLLHQGQVAEAPSIALSNKNQSELINAALSSGGEPDWVNMVRLHVQTPEARNNRDKIPVSASESSESRTYVTPLNSRLILHDTGSEVRDIDDCGRITATNLPCPTTTLGQWKLGFLVCQQLAQQNF